LKGGGTNESLVLFSIAESLFNFFIVKFLDFGLVTQYIRNFVED